MADLREEPRGPAPLSLFWVQKKKRRKTDEKKAGRAGNKKPGLPSPLPPPPSGQGLDAPLCTTLIHYQADK